MMTSAIPNLAGVIKTSDVLVKGTGSFKASYVPWAKTTALLQEHAAGWEFHLMPYEGKQLVHPAPDGTGYLMGYFTGPDGEATAEFPFPCMDNQNKPIQLERISARVLTDSHRRALAACAAFTFGLAYELWAKEEIGEHDAPLAAVQADPEPAATQQRARRAATPATPAAAANSKAFDAGSKAIASAATLDALKGLGERLQARFDSGDLTSDERDQLLQQLLDREASIA